MKLSDITLDYVADFLYGASRFSNGFLSPRVWYGHFARDDAGEAQRTLFHSLRDQGFERTPFQLVFPEQTAGLVQRLGDEREAHVRFYPDAISCELEYGRFDTSHWIGERTDGSQYLTELIEADPTLDARVQQKILDQVTWRDAVHTFSRDDGRYLAIRDGLAFAEAYVAIFLPLGLWEYVIGPKLLESFVKLVAP